MIRPSIGFLYVSLTFDDKHGVEHSGVGFVDLSQIFGTQDTFLFETEPFDRMKSLNIVLVIIIASNMLRFISVNSPIDNYVDR